MPPIRVVRGPARGSTGLRGAGKMGRIAVDVVSPGGHVSYPNNGYPQQPVSGQPGYPQQPYPVSGQPAGYPVSGQPAGYPPQQQGRPPQQQGYPQQGYPQQQPGAFPGQQYPPQGQPQQLPYQPYGQQPYQQQYQQQPSGWQKFIAVNNTIRTIRLFVSLGVLLLLVIVGGVAACANAMH